MTTEQPDVHGSNLPHDLSAPAQRALAQAGYSRLEQLAAVRAADVARLHGVGPKAIGQLRRALQLHRLSFAGEETDLQS
jgi:hypothetical protein